MTDLTARLEVLMRRYAAACVSLPPSAALDRMAEEFRTEIDLLAAKYGQKAVDKAMNAMSVWPSVSLR